MENFTNNQNNNNLIKLVQLRQKAILDNIPDIAWLKDSQGHFIMANEQFCKACGFKLNDLLGKTDLDIWPKDLAQAYIKDDQEVIKSKKRKCVQERLLDKEGKISWIETVKTPIFDDENNIIGTTGIARDITKRKLLEERAEDVRAELELRVKVRTAELVSANDVLRKEITERKIAEINLKESENKFKTIFESSLEGLVILNLTTKKFIYSNKAFCQMFGYNQDELTQIGIKDIHFTSDLPLVFAAHDKFIKKTIETVVFNVKRKDDSIFYAEISGVPLIFNKQECLLGTFRDITENKKAIEEIIKLASIVKFSADLINLSDLDGKMVFINEAGSKILGIPQNETQQFNILDVIPDHYLSLVKNEIIPKLKKGEVWKGELQYTNIKTKILSDVQVVCFPVNDATTGLPVYFAYISHDISERKKNEELTLQALSLQNATLEATADGILVVDLNRKIISTNDKFYKLWKIPDNLRQTRDELKLLDYVLDQLADGKNFLAKVTQLYKNPNEEAFVTINFKDGRTYEMFCLPQRVENKIVGRVWSFHDITKTKDYENELKVYHEKLEILVEQRTKALETEMQTRKNLENKASALHRQIEFILGATKTGLDIIDKDYNMIYVDPEWSLKYGDWKGKKCYEYFMDRKTVCPKCAIEESFKTKKTIISEEALLKEGGRPIQVTTIPFQDEKGDWFVAEVNVDITEKKKSDEELLRYRNHLEQLVEERTQDLLKETARYRNAEFEKSKLNRELLKTNEKLKSISLIDSQTGLFNYRYLQEVIEAEFHQARRYAQNLAIIMLDVDYFKSINDVYGVAFGDLVLKQLAKQLKKMVRRYDILIRYSGEEFIIISPRLDRTIAFNMAQRLLESLNFINFGNKQHNVKLKISFSVVSFPEDRVMNGIDLVNLANKVLNKVKENGGNRVFTTVDMKSSLKKGLEKLSKAMGVKSLKNKIDKLNKQSKQGLSESIFAFAKTLELKDHYTGEHVENTVHFATQIAKELNLPNEDIELIKQAAMLHDLGKIGISENILLKKGKLNKKEFEEIKRHPQIGADIIRPIQFLHALIPFIFYHHERWDGKGYPSGIKGEDIPLGARVIAIADVYQALISDRPYHKAFSKAAAIDIIKKASGTQFDPRIVTSFLKIIGKEKKGIPRR
ncbi:MAG: PAS domain S-box protein [Candidatus Omnitrophota bacterium]